MSPVQISCDRIIHVLYTAWTTILLKENSLESSERGNDVMPSHYTYFFRHICVPFPQAVFCRCIYVEPLTTAFRRLCRDILCYDRTDFSTTQVCRKLCPLIIGQRMALGSKRFCTTTNDTAEDDHGHMQHIYNK